MAHHKMSKDLPTNSLSTYLLVYRGGACLWTTVSRASFIKFLQTPLFLADCEQLVCSPSPHIFQVWALYPPSTGTKRGPISLKPLNCIIASAHTFLPLVVTTISPFLLFELRRHLS